MLSYQHGFHAGNFADVIKHIVLIRVIKYLIQKDKPLCYVDTHAGRGGYDLNNPEAQKNKEYLTGIAKLLGRKDLPDCVADYVNLIMQSNPDGQLLFYPGSPLLAAQLLRLQDRLFCYERHPHEFRQLQGVVKFDKRIKAIVGDGFKDCLGLLPPKERRGLILIDPPYELKTDYREAVRALQNYYKRFSMGCYLLWYPVVSRVYIRTMEKTLRLSGVSNILLIELSIKPDTSDFGMTASGMIVINPPWTLLGDMKIALPWLAQVLGENNRGSCRIEELVGEPREKG